MVDLTPDFHRRDCSLPMGCKDLLDVLNLADEVLPESPVGESPALSPFPPPVVKNEPSVSPEPVLMKPVEIGDQIRIQTLAELLGCPAYRIIALLIQWHIFVPNADSLLTFEQAERVAVQMGFEVRRLN